MSIGVSVYPDDTTDPQSLLLYADLAMYDSSLYFFQRTLEGRRKNSDNVTIISSLINISVVLNNLKRYDDSAKFLK